MKKMILPFYSLLLAGIVFTSCSKSATEQAAQTTPVTTAAIAGNYTLTSYRQKTEDKSAKFEGYVFVFAATGTNNGTVTATKGGKSVNGSWIYTPAVTYYGSGSKNALLLAMGITAPFDQLTKTWNFDSTSTANKLMLSSPEITEDEHLVLTKQ